MEKMAIVSDFLGIDGDNPFWELYDEYETKRKELGKERLAVLGKYLENYMNTMTSSSAPFPYAAEPTN